MSNKEIHIPQPVPREISESIDASQKYAEVSKFPLSQKILLGSALIIWMIAEGLLINSYFDATARGNIGSAGFFGIAAIFSLIPGFYIAHDMFSRWRQEKNAIKDHQLLETDLIDLHPKRKRLP